MTAEMVLSVIFITFWVGMFFIYRDLTKPREEGGQFVKGKN